MDVFPSDASFFRSPEYWGSFYSNPKLKDFDWYGSLDDFLASFNRSLSNKVPHDASAGFKHSPENCVVINVGCGNSSLPFKLFELGYRKIFNLDFCPSVLDEMRKKDRQRSMHWVEVDVSNPGYETFGQKIDNDFQGHPKVIIDKAFLDAYISVGEGESQSIARDRARRYIGSTLSFMKRDDIFLIFSLAQDYVVAELVRNLLFKEFYVDIYPLYGTTTTKAHMIQFLFAIYKKDPLAIRKQCMMSEMPHLPLDHFELGTLPKRIRTAKGAVVLGSNMSEYNPGRRVTFDIYPKDLQSKVCFTAAVYDCIASDHVRLPTAAIIVPTGQEHCWQYACSEGNEELAHQAGAQRLIVLWLKFSTDTDGGTGGNDSGSVKGFVNPFDACFGDDVLMSYIQENMSDILLRLSLGGTRRVVILKAGESCAVRAPRRVASSVYAGDIVVHEILDRSKTDYVCGHEVITRQMVFSCSPQTVQSEVRYYLNDAGVETFLNESMPSEYLNAMLLSTAFLPPGHGILSVLGSGSGTLPRILRRLHADRIVHAVDIDDAVSDIAQSHFGYSPDAVVRIDKGQLSPLPSGHLGLVHISGDALDYIDCIKALDISCLFLDINNILEDVDANTDLDFMGKNTLMSPHPKFLATSWLVKVASLLSKTHGSLVINVLTRSATVLDSVLSRLSSVFAWVGVIKMPSDINKVVVCLTQDTSDAKSRFGTYVSGLSECKSFVLCTPQKWSSESLSVFHGYD